METGSDIYVVLKIVWRDPFCYLGEHSDSYAETTSVLCACLDYESAVKSVEMDGDGYSYEMEWAGEGENRWYYGYAPMMDDLRIGECGVRYEIKKVRAS